MLLYCYICTLFIFWYCEWVPAWGKQCSLMPSETKVPKARNSRFWPTWRIDERHLGKREREGKWKRERDSWRKPRVQAFIMWTCWHVNMLMINQFVPVAARLDLLTKWCSRARPKCKNCEHNRIDRAVRPAREWKSKVAFGFSWCTAQLSPCQWYAFHSNWQSSNTCGTAAWNDDCTCSPWCCTILWPASASFHCSVWFNNATRRDLLGLRAALRNPFNQKQGQLAPALAHIASLWHTNSYETKQSYWHHWHGSCNCTLNAC